MKRFIALAAATTAAVLPTAAFAVTSGTLDGGATVPYSCDLTLPNTQTLVVSGTTASLSDVAIGLMQTGDTQYEVTALTITKPAAATTTGAIVVKRAGGAVIVTADDSSDTSVVTGAFSESGTVDFSQTETALTAMVAGDYAVETTISCSEDVGGLG